VILVYLVISTNQKKVCMSAKIAWLVTDTKHGVPYLVYREPNLYVYGFNYTSVQKIVYFLCEEEK
jgi:hypothetical protein